MKSVGEGLVQIESSDTLKPALVSIEDGWQLGYWLEQLQNGWVAVSAGADTDVGQHHVSPGEPRAAFGHHDD